jgi:chromosome segregation ATPase
MVKRGVLGAALGAGALALLFGTAAPSYVKTAFHGVRQSVKDNVPIEFQISRARQELAELKPAMHKCLEDVARAEYRVGKLQEEIVAHRDQLDREGKAIVALRKHRDNGDVQLTGTVTYTPAEIDRDLARRFDRYQESKKALAEKVETLKARKQAVQAAREQLDNMQAAESALLAKIETIEAKFRQIEAKQAAAAVSFDNSALSRLKETVNELEERVSVMDRVTSQQARLTDHGLPVAIEPGRDVLKEIDSEFGTPAKDSSTASTDKNL